MAQIQSEMTEEGEYLLQVYKRCQLTHFWYIFIINLIHQNGLSDVGIIN